MLFRSGHAGASLAHQLAVIHVSHATQFLAENTADFFSKPADLTKTGKTKSSSKKSLIVSAPMRRPGWESSFKTVDPIQTTYYLSNIHRLIIIQHV